MVVEAARGARVSSLIKAIISDGKLSIPLDKVALWELKGGKKVQRLDALSTVDKLDGTTLRLDATGGGESLRARVLCLLHSRL